MVPTDKIAQQESSLKWDTVRWLCFTLKALMDEPDLVRVESKAFREVTHVYIYAAPEAIGLIVDKGEAR